jgi:LmeA-like phospholipid-binding
MAVVTDPGSRPANQVPPDPRTEQIPSQRYPPDAPTVGIPQQRPRRHIPTGLPPAQPPNRTTRRSVIIAVVVVALLITGVLGGELYARYRADSVVAQAVQCVVHDTANVSFGGRPFLLQYMTGTYSNIAITTAGNQIREAKGMTVDLNIDNVALQATGDSTGTIGSLSAALNWSSDGIKRTVQSAIPLLDNIISDVTTNPSNGTLALQSALGSVTVKPQIVDTGFALQVISITGLGVTLPRDTIQSALDTFTTALTKNYPLGIHADRVHVTQDGVVAKFSSQNANIPRGTKDPCFANL